MQSIRRCHIDAALEQAVDEAGVLLRVDVLTVVTVIENGIAIGEVDLEHRPETLHHGFDPATTKNFAQARQSPRPQLRTAAGGLPLSLANRDSPRPRSWSTGAR